MVSQLLGVGVGQNHIGHVPLVAHSLVPHVLLVKLLLYHILVLLVDLYPVLHVLSHSPQISHTAVLKAVLSLEHSVSYQTANV